jgi:hypothetical protein
MAIGKPHAVDPTKMIQVPHHNSKSVCATCNVCGQCLACYDTDSLRNMEKHFLNSSKSDSIHSSAHSDAYQIMKPLAWQKDFTKAGITFVGIAGNVEAGGGKVDAGGSPVKGQVARQHEEPAAAASPGLKRHFSSNVAQSVQGWKEHKRRLDLKLAMLIACCNLPLSLCRNDTHVGQRFSSFVDALNNRYKVPGKRRLHSLIMQLYLATRDVIKRVIACADSKPSAESDIWTSKGSIFSACNVNVTYVLDTAAFSRYEGKFPHASDWKEGDYEVVNMCLGVEEFHGKHGGVEIAVFTAQLLAKYGLMEGLKGDARTLLLKSSSDAEKMRIPAEGVTSISNLTTDSAANALAAVNKYMGANSQKCAAHLVSTAVGKGVKPLKEKKVLGAKCTGDEDEVSTLPFLLPIC